MPVVAPCPMAVALAWLACAFCPIAVALVSPDAVVPACAPWPSAVVPVLLACARIAVRRIGQSALADRCRVLETGRGRLPNRGRIGRGGLRCLAECARLRVTGNRVGTYRGRRAVR